MDQIEYKSESVKEVAKETGFTTPFNPLIGTPLLLRDTAVDRVYFHLSGGRGYDALGMGRGIGRPTCYSLLKRSAREQWNRDHKDEWTLLREKEDTYEFIDHYVCNGGKTRFTAGTLDISKYPDKIPVAMIEHPSFKKRGLAAAGWGRATGIEDYDNPVRHPFTAQDKMMLALRDYRWENFSDTKREIDWGMAIFGAVYPFGTGGAFVGGVLTMVPYNLIMGDSSASATRTAILGVGAIVGACGGLAYHIKNILEIKKDKKAEQITLDNLLFNEDVIKYLEFTAK